MTVLALELENVGKRYGKDVVLRDVSMQLASGDTLVLFGPSGSGKTVLLRLIAGVVEADSGVIRINGKDMIDAEPEERGIGMAFQNFALFPHMSAFDNIASPLTAKKFSKEKIKLGVESVARLLKIDHVLSHAPRELSNGQKQRTALARALAAQPKLLLLDDPLRNVDAKLRFEMRLELPRLLSEQGATVVYVTQDYKEAMALGKQIAVLNAGGVAQHGTPEDIYNRPASIEIARLFGDPTINLLAAELSKTESGLSLQLADIELPIATHLQRFCERATTLGIRPEQLWFCSADQPHALAVEVAAETPLNEKIVTLVVTSSGQELLVSRPSHTPGPALGEAHITFALDQPLLFDHDGLRCVVDDASEASAPAASGSASGSAS